MIMIEAANLGFEYPDGTSIFQDFNLSVGAGKPGQYSAHLGAVKQRFFTCWQGFFIHSPGPSRLTAIFSIAHDQKLA